MSATRFLADSRWPPSWLAGKLILDAGCGAGRFADEARAVVADLHARGKCVFLTGGTGLYIRAVVEGLLSGAPADPV
ncbi:MAG: hypothetical protein IH808_13890 [Proteobacteria bacterium]|nr:hypothetical protein [Pseudomonadota bacterium]